MSIAAQVKKPFQWVGRRAYNTWFWASRKEEHLRQLFELCPNDHAQRGDYPSDRFKKLLRACGIQVEEHGTYDWCELHFQGSKCHFDEWPRGELVNVNIICDVRKFLHEAGVREPGDIYNHLHGV